MTKQIAWVKRAIAFHSSFVTHSSSFAALYSFLTPCKKVPVTRCRVTHYSLLFSESLVSRCKNRSLLVTKSALYLLQINFLLTLCNVQPSLITRFSFQNRSLVVAKIARYSLQKMLFTCYKYQSLLLAKSPITCFSLQNRSLPIAKFTCYSQKLLFARCENHLLLIAKFTCYSQKLLFTCCENRLLLAEL